MRYAIFIMLLATTACKKQAQVTVGETSPATPLAVRSADLSFLPAIEAENTIFYNRAGQAENMLQTLKASGVNMIRIRLWNNPATSTSSFAEVKAFAARIHAMGLKVWLCLHYSDTWADPGNQQPPAAWQGLSFAALKDSVFAFTKKAMADIQPELVQIGNEINPGLLLPYGDISLHEAQSLDLLSTGCRAARAVNPAAKIMIHYAGINGTGWFFSKLRNLDYDIAGISYYPIWHGKNLDDLKSTLQSLRQNFNKETLVAETAYPFTLQWNDWTNNILGSNAQIIEPAYPATPEGQKAFMEKIKSICQSANGCLGFCYWGGEWVAYKGVTATNGSFWENMALYDFSNKALPVLNAFAP
jgi:arabinogalactan endo-1,4-beta-galactosidase